MREEAMNTALIKELEVRDQYIGELRVEIQRLREDLNRAQEHNISLNERLSGQIIELRELLSEWRRRWFLGEGLSVELEQATLAVLGEKEPGEEEYRPGTGSIILSAPRVTP